jgi:hypothetical protein
MSLARLLTKLSNEEEFVEEDWNDVVSLFFSAVEWLSSNSRIEVTPESSQIHFQPKNSKKRSKKKE